jgi:hypothetical protein
MRSIYRPKRLSDLQRDMDVLQRELRAQGVPVTWESFVDEVLEDEDPERREAALQGIHARLPAGVWRPRV